MESRKWFRRSSGRVGVLDLIGGHFRRFFDQTSVFLQCFCSDFDAILALQFYPLGSILNPLRVRREGDKSRQVVGRGPIFGPTEADKSRHKATKPDKTRQNPTGWKN